MGCFFVSGRFREKVKRSKWSDRHGSELSGEKIESVTDEKNRSPAAHNRAGRNRSSFHVEWSIVWSIEEYFPLFFGSSRNSVRFFRSIYF